MECLQAINLYLLPGALLVLAGIASSLLARRFGAPLLLIFLVLGLLVARALNDERVAPVGIKFVGVGSHVFGDDAATYSLPGLWQRLRRKSGST